MTAPSSPEPCAESTKEEPLPDYDHRRISEGYCPTGHRLRIREDLPGVGWCVTCRCGFSVTPEAVTLTLVPRFESTKEDAE